MRLKTIWTLPSMQLMERLRRTRDLGYMTLGAKLPVRLRYFVAINEIAKATMDSPNVPATPLDEILRKLEAPKNLA